MKENIKQELREVLFQIELIKRKRVQEFLLRIGLTPGQGQARILAFLDSHSSVTQREISDACMLDVTTMSRTLDKLEKQGLILRERDPGCRRSYQISLNTRSRVVQEGFCRAGGNIMRRVPEEEAAVTDRTARKGEKKSF